MHCDNMNQLIGLQEMFLVGTSIGLFVGIIFIEFFGKNMLISISLILTTVSLIIVLWP